MSRSGVKGVLDDAVRDLNRAIVLASMHALKAHVAGQLDDHRRLTVVINTLKDAANTAQAWLDTPEAEQ